MRDRRAGSTAALAARKRYNALRMKRMRYARCALLLAAFLPAEAQTGLTLVGAGYVLPTKMHVAPGQVITIYMAGMTTILSPGSRLRRATSVPLPKTLAGFAVKVRQGTNTYSAPLLTVQQTPVCSESNSSSADCYMTALTVEIPIELAPAIPTHPAPPPADLIVNDNGTDSKPFPLMPVVDNIHVITLCDVQVRGPSDRSCPALVLHADGTVVSPTVPAKAGEEVVIYAFGLGQTTPLVKTGDPTPLPAPTVAGGKASSRTVSIEFDFGPNATPSYPYVNPVSSKPVLPTPEFVGLTAGFVGLYQINVKLPDKFPRVPRCSLYGSPAAEINVVHTNLTVNIGGVSSFDGAETCDEPN